MAIFFLLCFFIFLFHGWLVAWYLPRHCLSGRRVTWGERYRAFAAFILEQIKCRGGK